MEPNIKVLLSIKDTEETHNIPRQTLYARIKTGSLRAYDANGKIYLDPDDVSQWHVTNQIHRRSPIWQKIQELHDEGYSDAAMSEETGRSRERVRQIRSGLGKAANPRRPMLPKGTYVI